MEEETKKTGKDSEGRDHEVAKGEDTCEEETRKTGKDSEGRDHEVAEEEIRKREKGR